MNSIRMPNIFSHTVTNTVSDYDATAQNLKYLLLSSKDELFGDPYFGTNLRKYFFEQNDTILKDIIIDDIYTAIATFMPQLRVTRKDIDIVQNEKGTVSIYIKAINQKNFKTDMYNIVLFDTNN